MAPQTTKTEKSASPDATPALAAAIASQPLPENGELEADDDNASFSDYGSSLGSETQSIHSAIWRGHIENGRKYSVLADSQYFMPADERQMDSWNAGHLSLLVLDSQEANPLFRSPIPRTAQNILDIGTGDGSWAVDVADKFPGTTIYGVDLYPPPDNFVPPNCVFELDDVTKEWTWKQQFSLVHLRWLTGSYTLEQWTKLYAEAYKSLEPGGWIEQVEPDVISRSDDGTVIENSALWHWGRRFERMGEKCGRPFGILHTMRARIEAAGFTNVKEILFKVPIGPWTRHPLQKEAGRLNEEQFRAGMEGYAMHMLTNIGDPDPLSAEEVQLYLAQVRKDLAKPGTHSYIYNRRVWAQKPFDDKAKEEATAAAA